jgi:hypothetical protein
MRTTPAVAATAHPRPAGEPHPDAARAARGARREQLFPLPGDRLDQRLPGLHFLEAGRAVEIMNLELPGAVLGQTPQDVAVDLAFIRAILHGRSLKSFC